MKRNKLKSGFTLIETIIAISILAATITAILMPISGIIINTKGQLKEATAKYLLQEGLEYVRNSKDSALNGGATWSEFTTSGACVPGGTIGAGTTSLCDCIYASGITGACSIDPLAENKENEIISCLVGNCSLDTMVKIWKYEDTTRSFYCLLVNCPTSPTPRQTSFVRTIRLTPNPSNADELFVDVNVTWQGISGTAKQRTLMGSVFNW